MVLNAPGLCNWVAPSRHRQCRTGPEEELSCRGLKCVDELFYSLAQLNTSLLFSETQIPVIEAAFEEFTTRKDIAILLINQHVCPPMIITMCMPTTRALDCREDSAHGGQVPTSLPCIAGDSFQGSSIRSVYLSRSQHSPTQLVCMHRPEQGFSTEARPEAFWRMNTRYSRLTPVQDT